MENKESLVITMDLPGVKKEDVSVKLENNILEIGGRIDYQPYEKLNLVYAEYNIGNYARKFTASHAVDTRNIDAALERGVLTLTLLKALRLSQGKYRLNETKICLRLFDISLNTAPEKPQIKPITPEK